MIETDGQRLLTAFGARIGIPDLAFEAGDCVLAFDDVAVTVEERAVDRVLILSAAVHTIAGRLSEGALRAIAEIGSGLALNGLGALSLDPSSGRTLLVERLALAALDVYAFESALEAMVRRVETLQPILAAPGFGGEQAAERAAATVDMTIIRA